MVVERLFLAVPWGCLRFVIVVFPDHAHLLFLVYQTDAFSANFQSSDEKRTSQKEVEDIQDNDNIDCLMKTLLKQAILTCLKMAAGDCVKHECQGCRIDHPSQKYHNVCLWTSPREWIEDYGFHYPALEGLNIDNRDQSPDARRKSRSL